MTDQETIQAAAKAAYEQYMEVITQYTDTDFEDLSAEVQTAWIAAVGAAWEILDDKDYA